MQREHDSDELKIALAAAESFVERSVECEREIGPREGDPPVGPWPKLPARLVFLDFDGVLNSDQSIARLGTRYKFDSTTVELVNDLCRAADARIVVSSTWREHWSLTDVISFLERDGLDKDLVIDRTPVLGTARGLEINDWLERCPFEVRNHVIIDDHDDMEMHISNLVQTDSELGLQKWDVDRAIKILQCGE